MKLKFPMFEKREHSRSRVTTWFYDPDPEVLEHHRQRMLSNYGMPYEPRVGDVTKTDTPLYVFQFSHLRKA